MLSFSYYRKDIWRIDSYMMFLCLRRLSTKAQEVSIYFVYLIAKWYMIKLPQEMHFAISCDHEKQKIVKLSFISNSTAILLPLFASVELYMFIFLIATCLGLKGTKVDLSLLVITAAEIHYKPSNNICFRYLAWLLKDAERQIVFKKPIHKTRHRELTICPLAQHGLQRILLQWYLPFCLPSVFLFSGSFFSHRRYAQF